MHATPPAVAPPSAIVQRRQILLVAAAAVVAFALAFGIGKLLSGGADATASPERPQAIAVSSAAIAVGRPSAGAIPGLKDPARPTRHHRASKPKTTSNNSAVQPQQQTVQPQQQTVQPQQQTVQPQQHKKTTTQTQTITSGGGED